MHVVIGTADRIGPADDRRDRIRAALQRGGQIGDDLLPVGVQGDAVGGEIDVIPDRLRSGLRGGGFDATAGGAVWGLWAQAPSSRTAPIAERWRQEIVRRDMGITVSVGSKSAGVPTSREAG
jgi:hypothetical protein